MLKDAHGDRAGVEHQILAYKNAGISEAIRKLLVGGEQKQARGFGAVGADDDCFGFLEMGVALLVEVDSTDGAAVSVGFNAMDVGIWSDFAAASFFSHANGSSQRTGFGAN